MDRYMDSISELLGFKYCQQGFQRVYFIILYGCLSASFCLFWDTISNQSNCPSQILRLAQHPIFLSWSISKSQFGSSSNCRFLTQMSISCICGGKPAHSTFMGMDSFLSIILSYFSRLSSAFRFCQGKLPLRKYMSTQTKLSRSSLLDCSMPICVLMETYLAVPVSVLFSRQGICCPLLLRNLRERPKSIIQTLLEFALQPIKKLSGLISRCRVSLECTYRMSSSICRPTIMVVFTVNHLSQRLNRSQRLGPRSSSTMTLQSPQLEQQCSFGMATSCCPLHREVIIRDYTQSCRRVLEWGYFFMATQTSVLVFMPMKISPKAPQPSLRWILQVPLIRSVGRCGGSMPETVYYIMFDPYSQETEQYVEDLKSGSNNMLVAVRCRPLNSKELALSDFETVKVLNSKLVVLLDPGNEFEPEDIFRKNRNKEMQYAFDFAFDKFVDNSAVYEDTVSFLIEGVIDGYNATVFAYGATGCGKTYTMVGTPEKPGIMPKCMSELFAKVDSQSYTKDVVIKVSYLEIYNQNIKDLLISEDRNFELRQDPKLGVVIAGITEVPVHNIMEINALLKVGNRNRTKQATGANDTSSRSHGILQVTVETKDKNQGLNTEIKTSKLSLVDLAGSERASSTTNRGMRMVEGAKINQSLLILGNCIQALSEATEKGLKKAFIPYRGSKMTRLLKDSLGGNCRTVMIANVSPAVSSFQDTYNTLLYANRAKSIKTNAQRNVLSVDNHIANYANIISNLRKQNQDLKLLLNKNQNELNKVSLPTLSNSNQPAIISNIESHVNAHFEEEMNLMKKAFENDEQVENIGFQIFKLMIRQDKEREALKDGVPSTKESKDGATMEIKDKIEQNKALAQSFFLKKEECLKELRDKVATREKLVGEVKNSELTQPNQNYLLTLIKQQQIAVEKQEVIYKERKIENESKQKELLISYLKNQVSLRDKIIEQQKLLIQKNKIISRITYSKLKDLTQISNQAKLAFPQIQRSRAQSLKRDPPRHLERARSIDKIDYDFVESPRRRNLDNHGNSLSSKKKAYYNLDVEHEMKKKQLRSDASVDSLSDKNMSKKKKKISYMYPERLKEETEAKEREAERADRVRNVARVKSKDRLQRSPESLPNPLFLKKKPKYQASPQPQKHDNLNVYMIQR